MATLSTHGITRRFDPKRTRFGDGLVFGGGLFFYSSIRQDQVEITLDPYPDIPIRCPIHMVFSERISTKAHIDLY